MNVASSHPVRQHFPGSHRYGLERSGCRFAGRKVLAVALVIAVLLLPPPGRAVPAGSFRRRGCSDWSALAHHDMARGFPEGGAIYSNNPAAIYFVLGRPAVSI
jgi:hypothetical protein